ncbi:thiamine biosynthesis protein ThiC [uncultured Erythrobacter sp.]|uniref:thiamine biosynthesis protein ThiC n=1 Tax=uncultured Erythrobacter sp. TaxID=263913 RepID=UPI002601E7D6|nr:thiamine biosynthesis protein ThiC [uncultured Erythrobacter sp.]
MDITYDRTVKLTAWLLLLAALSQPVYTALYILAPEVDRGPLWSFEALLFTLMAALAGSALVQAKSLTLGWSAIAMSAVLNVIQVGIGLVQFGPFREVAEANAALEPAASAVVALSFFGYNAAKVLLGLAAMVFGYAKVQQGSKALGGLTFVVGALSLFSNAIVMGFGLGMSVTGGGLMPSGASGVAATLLLAVCLFTLPKED